MPARSLRRRPGLWGGVFLVLLGAGAMASLLTMIRGTDLTARLNDVTPWGLCVGLDVFCGIALATGALWVAVVARAVGIDSWRSVRAASLCIALAAYVVAILGSFATLGLKQHAWPAIIRLWSPWSVVSGAVWTLLLLAVLLFLEFPAMISIAPLDKRWVELVRHVQVVLLVCAALIATMHQNGVTRVLSVAEGRLVPLWSGPSLALQFFISSLCGALAVLLFASWRSLIAFRKRLPMAIAAGIARLLTIAVFLYLVLRLTDLGERNLGPDIFRASRESGLLWLELGLLLLGMMWASANEGNPRHVYYGSAMVLAGVVANRLNTSITALQQAAGLSYQPNWNEIVISYSLIAVGIAMFALCVKHLPVFVDEAEGG